MLFYGGSTVESWRGTERGELLERAKGIPAMWGRHFGEPYRAAAFGIASKHPFPPLLAPSISADKHLLSILHCPCPTVFQGLRSCKSMQAEGVVSPPRCLFSSSCSAATRCEICERLNAMDGVSSSKP